MKVNKRPRKRLSKRTSAALSLVAVLVFTICFGYLGLHGTWLDSRGLWKLLPWVPTADVDNWPTSVSLGLDLKGGVFVEYEASMSEEMRAEGNDFGILLDSTIAIIGNRLTEKGYAEATVSRLGASGIRVEIPDVTDPDAVLDLIGSPAKLEFLDPEGNVFLQGHHLQAAYPTRDEQSNPAITFRLNSEGATIFGDATAKSIGKQITITLDGETLMSPVVNAAIYGGDVLITGDFDVDRAQNIALQLQSGALPLTLRQDKLDTISATLGVDALSTSITAGMIGILLVMLIMVLRYRLCGILASWALCLYLLLVFMATAVVPGVQLTLPGIAGLILGIGMAVDSNVLIFERMREETRAGRPLAHAVRIGFKNAMSAVMDSNITTIISAVVLLFFGTGTVQGFAITLLISVLMSMFSAIVISRFLLTNAVRLLPTPVLYVPGASKTNENQEVK